MKRVLVVAIFLFGVINAEVYLTRLLGFTGTSNINWKGETLGSMVSVEQYKKIERSGLKIYGTTEDGKRLFLYLNGQISNIDVSGKKITLAYMKDQVVLNFSEVGEVELIKNINGSSLETIRVDLEDAKIKKGMTAAFFPSRYNQAKSILRIDIRSVVR